MHRLSPSTSGRVAFIARFLGGVGIPGTVRVFRRTFTLVDAIGSHTGSLEALTECMRVTNGIPLGCPLPLIVITVITVRTLKVFHSTQYIRHDAKPLCGDLFG